MNQLTVKKTVAVLPRELTRSNALQCAEEFLALFGSNPTISKFDLADIEKIDSAGLELLAKVRKTRPVAAFMNPSPTAKEFLTRVGALSLIEGSR